METWQNPNAGKLLGYVYDNTDTPTYLSGLYTSDDGTPQSRYSTMTLRKLDPASKAIPIYEPFFNLSWKGETLPEEQKFHVLAKAAGVEEYMPDVGKTQKGVLDSRLFSAEARQGIGLPNSFDMIRGVDPTKPDMGVKQWAQWNPKSSGFLGELVQGVSQLFAEFPLLQIALPGIVSAASGAATTAAAQTAAQQAASEATKSALSEALASGLTGAEAAAASGAAAASAPTGITAILADAGVSGVAADVVKNAATNAGIAAATGGDPLKAALSGAATTGIGGLVSGVIDDKQLATIASAAAKGATNAALSGGDPIQAAFNAGLKGAASVGVAQPLPVTTEEQIPVTDLLQPSVQDIIAAAQAGKAEQADLESFLRALEPTALESLIDIGYLGQEPTQAQTFPIEMPEAIQTLPKYETMEQLLADIGEPVPAAQAETAPSITATPTENWIDMGGLAPSTPLEIEIAGTGGTEQLPYSTATEDFIDAGGLTVGYPTTPTEDFIDQGGLGGGAGATPTTPTVGGGTATGGGQTARPPSTPATPTAQAPMDLTSLMLMMGLMGGKQQQTPPPIPVVEQISPYQFSTDLLEGIYQTPKMAQGGSINELMRILRG